MQPETPRDIDAAPISWRECGTGVPVVFLHAMVTSRLGWDPQMLALSDSYRCIAWDMPVSYTHLDVYKRQVLLTAAGEWSKRACPSLPMVMNFAS